MKLSHRTTGPPNPVLQWWAPNGSMFRPTRWPPSTRRTRWHHACTTTQLDPHTRTCPCRQSSQKVGKAASATRCALVLQGAHVGCCILSYAAECCIICSAFALLVCVPELNHFTLPVFPSVFLQFTLTALSLSRLRSALPTSASDRSRRCTRLPLPTPWEECTQVHRCPTTRW